MGEVDDPGGESRWAQTWLRRLARGQQAARPWGHGFILRLCIMEPLSLCPTPRVLSKDGPAGALPLAPAFLLPEQV